jgi:uncharacterized protein YjcR
MKRRRGGQPGNKNAVGHGAPRGNKNAFKHGAYERLTIDTMTDDELEVYIDELRRLGCLKTTLRRLALGQGLDIFP